jgi:hypothetical protein
MKSEKQKRDTSGGAFEEITRNADVRRRNSMKSASINPVEKDLQRSVDEEIKRVKSTFHGTY